MTDGATQVRDIAKTFGSGDGAVHALQGVSFDVGPGESIAIIGRNGAGKSTLLQIVAGVLAPTAGVVHRPARVASMLELGSGFHPDLTGDENLELGLSIASLTTDTSTVDLDEVVEFSGLGDALDQPVKHYSDGMKARLACSIAVHTEPDLLIVDEVLAVGDASFQREVLSKVHDLLEKGTTLLLVTHSVELARTTERAIWLDGGRPFRDGPTASILDEYEVTSSAARRYSSEPAARIERVEVEPGHIEPGDGFIVTARVRRLDRSVPLQVRVDLRPVVGEEPWMRKDTELAEHRDLNLVGTTGPRAVDDIEGEVIEVDVAVESLPITPTQLEVSFVLLDGDGVVHDELLSELEVGYPPGRAGYMMRLSRAGTAPSPEPH